MPPCGPRCAAWLSLLALCPAPEATIAPLDLATLAYSNLLGKGPDVHAPPTMRYHDVLRVDGRALDLVIMMGDNEYSPFNTSENVNSGVGGLMGNVNLQLGTKAHFLFRFVEAGTTNQALAPPFFLTVFLRDSLEQLQVTRIRSFCTVQGTVVKHHEIAPGVFAFATMSEAGTLEPQRPLDAKRLDLQELQAAVTFAFEAAYEFPMSLMSMGPVVGAGLRFSFSGLPTPECSARLGAGTTTITTTTLTSTLTSSTTATTTTTTLTSTSTTMTTTTPPYNCWAGLGQLNGWSERKRSWCCREQRLGCASRVTESNVVFNCKEGLEDEWTRQKSLACCVREGTGCLTMMQGRRAFDCGAGWRSEWSAEKQAFCKEGAVLRALSEVSNARALLPGFGCLLALVNAEAGR